MTKLTEDKTTNELMSAEGEKPKQKRGRPKGSRNIEREIVGEFPVQCPKCGSDKLKVQRTTKDMKHCATFKGKRFSRVKWQNVKCQCGQHLTVRKYYK